jgi:serine/threonine protein kinase
LIEKLNQNILISLGYTTKTENQFCSKVFKSYLLFEYCSHNLESERINRKIDNLRLFTPEEMWKMTEQYIAGLSFLQENKLSHGDVKPQTLLVTANGNFKVAEQSLLNPNSSYAQLLSNTQREYEGVFISPALLKVYLIFLIIFIAMENKFIAF